MTNGVVARPRIVWISDEPVDRNLGGGSIRQAHLVESLGRHADVHLVHFGPVVDDAVRAAVSQITELPAVRNFAPKNPVGRRLVDLWTVFGSRAGREVVITAPRRRMVRRHWSGWFTDADAVVVQQLALAPLVPNRRSIPWWVHFHHVPSTQWAQERQLASNRRYRWLLGQRERKARATQGRALASYDGVIVTCAEDAELLTADHAARRVVVAPNGVDPGKFADAPVPATPDILLPGSLGYMPNIDGAIWFAEKVFPLVRAEVPAARLRIVGREPRPEVLRLGTRPGITVAADVPSMAPEFAAARVVVVPLRIGTGTRLKALEGMAARRPVVGTTVGLSGISITPGREAVVADEPRAFAAEVVRLLRDDLEADRLAAAGRQYVDDNYRWDKIGERFAHELLQTLRAGDGPDLRYAKQP